MYQTFLNCRCLNDLRVRTKDLGNYYIQQKTFYNFCSQKEILLVYIKYKCSILLDKTLINFLIHVLTK